MVDLCGPPLKDPELEQFAQKEASIVLEALGKPPSIQAVIEADEAGDVLEIKIREYAATQHKSENEIHALIDQIGERGDEIINCERHRIKS